jgi:uncharacterized membrane protein
MLTFEILVIAAIVIAFCYWIEESTCWTIHVSSAALIIVFGSILANSDIISGEDATYDLIFKWAVPLGIVLMLIQFNPRHILGIKKEFMICFVAGAIGSILGGIVAGLLFEDVLPSNYWKVAGQLVATYTGGYENSAAVGIALEVPKNVFVQVIAADSILTTIWILINIWLGRKISGKGTSVYVDDEVNKFLSQNTDITSTMISIATAFSIIFAANYVANLFSGYASSKIILVSIFASAIAFTPLRQRFSGSYVLGSVIVSFFFFACGAISNVVELFSNATVLVFFPAIIVIVHGIIFFSFTKYFKIRTDVAIIVSQALIGGPGTALAVVMALRWPYRLEAVALGLLGYTLANYIGFGTAWIVKLL